MPVRVLLRLNLAQIPASLEPVFFPTPFRSKVRPISQKQPFNEEAAILSSLDATRRLNFYLFKSTIVGALGGLLFGFDTAVIAGATHQLTDIFHLSPGALGFTVSIALWGTVIGAMSAGAIGQKLGGREALRIMAVLYVISSIGCAFSWNWSSLVFFRFIGGL